MAAFDISITVNENGKKSPSWSIANDMEGEWTLAKLFSFTKSTLISVSREVLKEEQVKGFSKNPVTIVDGKFNALIENVSPLGKIEFVGQQPLDKILLNIYQNLLIRSPVLTGAYISSHYVYYNGERIASDLGSLKSWLNSKPDISDRDKIRFVDTQPYAGKLERNGNIGQSVARKRTSRYKNRKGMEVKKPNGSYVMAANDAKKIYGKNVYITFEFFPGARLGIPRVANSKHDYVYPTILVFLFKNGLTQ